MPFTHSLTHSLPTGFIRLVKVGGGFVQCEDSAGQAERLSQCKADDDGGQHSLHGKEAQQEMQCPDLLVHDDDN